MDLSLRKTYRAQLTRCVNAANDLLEAENANVEEIPVLIARINWLQASLSNINERLASTFNDDQLEAESEKIVEYEDAAVEAIARLEQRIAINKDIRRLSIPEETNVQLLSNGSKKRNDDNNNNTQTNGPKIKVRLPKLDLEKFNGDIESWPAFWEQFSIAIHDNNELDDSAKFTYLKSLLTGRASVTIAGLTSSHLSYSDAIDLLKSEYSNSERIVDCYIQKLLSIAPVKHEKDTQSLRMLYNTASTITRSLLKLGVSADQYGLMVKSIIFKALPYNLRVQFNKMKITNNNVVNDGFSTTGFDNDQICSFNSVLDYNNQITSLLQFIKVELDSIEQAQGATGNDNKYKHFNQRFNVFKRKDESCTAAGLFTSVKECCIFCKSKSHVTTNCNDSSISIGDKKDILKQNARCFRCTKANHSSRFCKVKNVRCTKCNGRHATTMCDPSFIKLDTRFGNVEKENETCSNATITNGNSTILLTNGRIDDVYLQTACAYLKSNVNGRDDELIRLVVDGGSQLTFIKECVSRHLDLQRIGTHKISILPFGSTSRSPARQCNRVLVNLKSQYSDEIITINAIEVPEICFESLRPPSLKDPVIRKFSISYPLADNNVQQRTTNGITLLVGADNYWKIINEETKCLSANLKAVNSKLGWTLHGTGNTDETYNSYTVNFSLAVLHAQAACDELDIKKFWDLETISINAIDRSTNNLVDKFMFENIHFKNGRYEVFLPWQSEDKLDDNYFGALAHVKNLTCKLCKNGKINEYDSAIREYLHSDCAETALKSTVNERTYYMPHKPVYREDKETTKVRVVFNASAHAPDFPSLNEMLSSGPATNSIEL